MKKLSLLLVAVSLFSCATQALSEDSPKRKSQAELIQTVPEETQLIHPGLAHAGDTWIKLINESKKSIDIEQMYLAGQAGKPLDLIHDALEAAANRGVKIRLILAKNMIGTDKPGLERLQKMPGFELGVIDLKKITGGIQHAKFWIFDKKITFVGSQNLDWRAISQIHEMGVLVNDKSTTQRLQTIFDIDWSIAQTGALPTKMPAVSAKLSDPTIELTASPAVMNPKNMRATLTTILELIKNAKNKIQIQVMDYSVESYSQGGQWLEINDALKAAAKRGVKVELLVSHWNTEKNDIGSIKEISKTPGIEVRICFLPEHSTGFVPYSRVIHSKYMVIDGKNLWLGTSNWSRGYFYGTRNTDFVFKRPELAQDALKVFAAVWTAPYTELIDVNKEYPEPKKGGDETKP